MGPEARRTRDFVGARSQILWSAYPINKSEAQRLLGVDALREKIQLARFRGTDKLRHEIGSAIVAGKNRRGRRQSS